jgi:hypothetical protein
MKATSWLALLALGGAQGIAANVLPRSTGLPTAAQTAPAPAVTGLERRVCVDTTFTGDLVGYYYNPSCGGLDEFRCLPDEFKTTSGSFFNCAKSGSEPPWPTACRSGTISLANSKSQVW